MPAETRNADQLLFVEPSPIARRLLWHLIAIGTTRLTEAELLPAQQQPGAHLFWVQSGEGEWDRERDRVTLRRGKKVWLADLTRPATFRPHPKRQLTLAGFRFAGPGLEQWHEEIRGDQQMEFSFEDFPFVTQAYAELLRLTRRRPSGWEWQAHMVITNLLGRLLMTRNLLTSPHAELPAPVLRVLNTIAANPVRDWKARELAAVARISYSGLRALFKTSGQGTVHAHIQRARLDQARLLLADKRLSIKDVASQLSFSSEFYFSHFFRHQTSMSPTEYRKHLKL